MASFETEKNQGLVKKWEVICLWEKILQVGADQKATFWEKSYPLAIFLNCFNFCFVQFDQAQVGVL